MPADDLEDSHHTFIISNNHAARNHNQNSYPSECFRDWNAWYSDLEGVEGVEVVGCFGSLAIGSNCGVELAQHVHS